MTARLLSIDPGAEQSGFVVYLPRCDELGRVEHILESGVASNDELLARCWRPKEPGDHLAIEMPSAAGMAGKSLFETCYWVGRFVEAFGPDSSTRVRRHHVRMHLLHSATGKDSLIRAALIERWGGKDAAIGGKGRGKAKTPCGPLHGIASHAWSALAVAVTWADTQGGAL